MGFHKKFSKEEDQIILDNYKNGAKICSNLLDLKIGQIWYRARKLGLKLTPEERGGIYSKSAEKEDDEYRINPNQFREITNPIVAYFLGYFWADGNIHHGRGYTINLSISSKDAEEILPFLKSLGDFSVKNRPPRNGDPISYKKITNISIYNKKIYDILYDLDFYTKSYSEPTKVLSVIPENLHHYWWRGYFDGDGCIDKLGTVVTFGSTYEYEWIETINLFESIDANNYIISRVATNRGNGSIIKLCSKDESIKFLDYIYQDYEINKIGLSRKYNRYYNNKSNRIKRGEIIGNENRIKATYNRRKGSNKVFGVSKRKSVWTVFVKEKYVGSYRDYDAAVNANNYYGKLEYKDLFIPNPVSKVMDFEEFSVFKVLSRKKKYCGILYRKKTNRWRATIYLNSSQKEIGSYKFFREAINAHNKYIDDNNLQISKHIVSEQDELNYLNEVRIKYNNLDIK